MKLFAIVFALLFSVEAFGASAADHGASRIWISDVTIISPENLDHIVEGSVLIENGRIVSIERKEGRKKPLGTTVVSGKGQFLIPGLIDSHVHLASIPGMQFEMSFDPAEGKPEMIKEYFKQLPRSYLYFGYTTLVDLAVIDRRVLDDFRQTPLHPDLYDCGQSLTFANGYPMSFAPPATTLVCVPPATSAITGAKGGVVAKRTATVIIAGTRSCAPVERNAGRSAGKLDVSPEAGTREKGQHPFARPAIQNGQ